MDKGAYMPGATASIEKTYDEEALLLHNFLDLLDHLIDPYLNLLLSFFSASFTFLTFLPISRLFFTQGTPSVPLVDETFPVGDKLGADVRFLRRVFLFEHSGVFSKVSADVALLLFC